MLARMPAVDCEHWIFPGIPVLQCGRPDMNRVQFEFRIKISPQSLTTHAATYDSIRAATFTTSPKSWKRARSALSTPAVTGPERERERRRLKQTTSDVFLRRLPHFMAGCVPNHKLDRHTRIDPHALMRSLQKKFGGECIYEARIG